MMSEDTPFSWWEITIWVVACAGLCVAVCTCEARKANVERSCSCCGADK